ncbi:MAG: hypothetical protein ACHQNT_09765 [Bacteroidia bacterium]
MKTKQNLGWFICIITVISILTSCNTVYHFDAAEYFKTKESNQEMPFSMKAENINAPLFSDSQKVNISGSLQFGGYNPRLAYKTNKNLLLMANYSTLTDSWNENNTISVHVTKEETYFDLLGYGSTTVVTEGVENVEYVKKNTFNQSSAEIAAGYIKEFGKGGQWNILAGGAKGNAENEYYYSVNMDPSYNATFNEKRNFYKLFLQNDIGYLTRITEGSLALRFSYLKFFDRQFTGDYKVIENPMPPYAMFLQPGFHFGIGSKNIRATTDFSYLFSINDADLNLKNSSLTLGCVIKF